MIKRLLLVLLPFAVVVLLVEIGLRATHAFHARLSWTEPDRQIGWRFTPGREYWFFAENDHAITGRINAMGWRDRDRTAARPAHTYRIAVIGDSYVEAFQVELDSTFTALAERALNAGASGAYEVMNFGRSGMSPTEESIVLEQDVVPCSPDLVLLVFTPHNDIADVNPVTAVDTGRPFLQATPAGTDALTLDTSFTKRRDYRMREAINPLKQHSALVSLVSERYNAWRLVRAKRNVARSASGLTREQSLCTVHPDPLFAKNYELCKWWIGRMARMCEARGIRFALASVPLVYEEDDVAAARSLDPSFDPGFFDRDLAAFAASSGLDFVPMTAEFAAEWARTGEPLHWQHWTYAGHRLVARLLVDALPRGRREPGQQAE
jgi:hypothetical protein